MEKRANLRVSYCTTCHGRLWQIALTIVDNLARLRPDEELVLIDYGSRDGLARYIESSPACQAAMESGRLVYGRIEAKHYHCPRAKNLAYRLGHGDLLVNLDADNSNEGMRRIISRRYARGQDVVLQFDEGQRGDPLRGTFGRICIPRYWFYRLGGYDESFEPIGHQDQDLIWRAKAAGLRHTYSQTGGAPPVRNTMVEKAAHTGKRSWHVMWRTNEKASRRNLKEGRLAANPGGWGAARIAINFNELQDLAPVLPQLISVVLLHRRPSVTTIATLIERYSAMQVVGEILVVNRNRTFTIAPPETPGSKVKVINAAGESQPFPRLAAGSLAEFPAVLLTSDDVFIPEESLNRMHKAWFSHSAVLHAVTVNGAPGRYGEADLSLGALSTVAACVTALSHGARLCAELAPDPPPGTEDVLLSAAGPIEFHASPGLEATSGEPAARSSRPHPDSLKRIRRWARLNVASGAGEELIVEAGPAPPAPIVCEPFFAPSSRHSVLFAGPWVGEFGWELCWWNPMVRAYAEHCEHVIVAAPEASRYLYEFATEFIPLKTEGWRFAEGRLLTKVPRVCNGSKVLDPAVLWEELGLQECDALRTGESTLTPKKWRDLAPAFAARPVADVLCAFRPEKTIGDRMVWGKDYPVEQCEELVRLLLAAGLSVACYGGLDNYWFEGTADLRGNPLEVQCSALSAAKCAVGPSSAPLHLASLSGCPHVTWSRISSDIAIRYATLWNPFHTPGCFIGDAEPSPADVAREVLHTIDAPDAGERRLSTVSALRRQAAAI
ncbi:MAG: glycosyltransferase family A protein [Bryobacteraceae bacterium]|jgi:hypothetical protein